MEAVAVSRMTKPIMVVAWWLPQEVPTFAPFVLTLAWLARPEKKEAMVVLLVFLVCCSQVELQGWLADTGSVARGVVGGGRETEQPARSPHPAGKQPPPKPPQPTSPPPPPPPPPQPSAAAAAI